MSLVTFQRWALREVCFRGKHDSLSVQVKRSEEELLAMHICGITAPTHGWGEQDSHTWKQTVTQH